MLKIKYTNQFQKDYKLIIKRGYKKEKLRETIELLSNEIVLPKNYKDHTLENSRNYKDVRECHIEPDWLLIYKIYKNESLLKLIRTGTHSDLFR